MIEDIVGIYNRPEFYDLLFPRDYVAENDFLLACLAHHGAASEPSLLELGCGPARNSRQFATRGHRTVALDLNPRMLAHAQREAEREGVTIELVEASLIDFDLRAPVTLAACLWDTICLIKSNEEMLTHLRAVARNLLPGGVYVVETTHPRFFNAGYTGDPMRARRGDLEVEVLWGKPDDPYDCIEQRYTTTIRTVVRQGSEVIAHSEETLVQRYFRVQELKALVALSGVFGEPQFYGTNALPFVPLRDTPECNGLLMVLSKP